MIVTKDLLFGYYYGWGALLVGLLVLAFLLWLFDNVKIAVCLVVVMVVIGCSGAGRDKDLPLSTIDQYIKVEKDKVIIDKLPYEIHYSDSYKKANNNDILNRNEVQIFKFDYDEFYQIGTLTSSTGGTFELSRTDAVYLKGKDGR